MTPNVELEAADRLLEDLADLCDLEETPAKSRGMLRSGRGMLKILLRQVSTGGKYPRARTLALVRRLTEQQAVEQQTGCRATLRRLANALEAVAAELDRINRRPAGTRN